MRIFLRKGRLKLYIFGGTRKRDEILNDKAALRDWAFKAWEIALKSKK